MRNRYPGNCYRCGERVEAGAGHFEKIMGVTRGWRTQHAECAIAYRGYQQKPGEILARPAQQQRRQA